MIYFEFNYDVFFRRMEECDGFIFVNCLSREECFKGLDGFGDFLLKYIISFEVLRIV